MSKRTARLNREQSPPPAGKRIQIECVPGGRTWVVIACASAVYGYYTHWAVERTRPCFTPRTSCEGCKNHCPRRWHGLLHVWFQNQQKECFVEITPSAFEQLRELHERGELRGQLLHIVRDGKTTKAPLRVTVQGKVDGTFPVPVECSPEVTLAACWGLTEL